MPDGRVEAIFEGELAEIGRLEETLRAAMRPNIENVTAEDTVATGEFHAFDIR